MTKKCRSYNRKQSGTVCMLLVEMMRIRKVVYNSLFNICTCNCKT